MNSHMYRKDLNVGRLLCSKQMFLFPPPKKKVQALIIIWLFVVTLYVFDGVQMESSFLEIFTIWHKISKL
jgi:hypothetical protein